MIPTVLGAAAPHEPWWIALIEAVVIVNVLLGLFAYLTLLERKLMGRMQLRYGPNRAGPFGLLQPIADLVKLVRKEAFSPSSAIELPRLSTLFPWNVSLAKPVAIETAMVST